MRLELFDYELPPERIAQTPLEPRDTSRLLVVGRAGGPERRPEHRTFADFPLLLEPGDLLVFNDTRVLPARLIGRKESGARVEALLLKRLPGGRWEALAHPGRRLREGTRVLFADGELTAEVVGRSEDGTRVFQFHAPGSNPHPPAEQEAAVDVWIHRLGQPPLPPYIHEVLADAERYQTIYARDEGSAAAPTAGLHFTPRTFAALRERGVGFAYITLHVGIGTFRPVKTEIIESHEMHAEWCQIPEETARAIRTCRGRVIAVGTTTMRALESAATAGEERLIPGSGLTRLYITPGYRFQVVDALLTNFHMPKSSLLILVSAFAGIETIQTAYREALASGYRFLSFGDAMFLEKRDSGVGIP